MAAIVARLPARLARLGGATAHCSGMRQMATAPPPTLLACNVYISEGRDAAVLAQLEAAARAWEPKGALLAHSFVDAPYHRVNYTLIGTSVPTLAAAATSLSHLALELVDLRGHQASHPRLGAVDHISCHPVGAALRPAAAAAVGGPAGAAAAAGEGFGTPTAAAAAAVSGAAEQLQQAAELAREIARRLGSGEHPPNPTTTTTTTAATTAAATATASGGGSGTSSSNSGDSSSGSGTGSGSKAPSLPVYLYGAAHPEGRPLDAVRRQLGYFRGAAASSWAGGLSGQQQQEQGKQQHASHEVPLALAPCYGPLAASQAAGVCCVGAFPWVVNYNVLLVGVGSTTGSTEGHAAGTGAGSTASGTAADTGASSTASSTAAGSSSHAALLEPARLLARAVSARGGGLPGVQAMALLHSEGVEVACNLLDPGGSPPEAVLAAVQALAGGAGLAVRDAYRTGKTPEQLLALAAQRGL